MRKVVKNWYSIVPCYLGMKKNCILYFRNGLLFWYQNGLFSVEHFLEEPYQWLNVKGKEVVDIGAFIGDSAIYFVRKGASKVLAFEPVPETYEVLKKNVELNGIDNIVLYNEAVGLKKGSITIPNNIDDYHSFSANRTELSNGREGRKRQFSEIAYSVSQNSVLRMDCEGCEEEIILGAEDEVLRIFEQIMIECHNNLSRIQKRFIDTGYTTKVLDIKGKPLHGISSPKLALLFACRQ